MATTLSRKELAYLLESANKHGLNGDVVVGFILPQSTTQAIYDTAFIIKRNEKKSDAD